MKSIDYYRQVETWQDCKQILRVKLPSISSTAIANTRPFENNRKKLSEGNNASLEQQGLKG